MKTQTTIRTKYYYDLQCHNMEFSSDKPGDYYAAIECDGYIDETGICKKCGRQASRYEYTTEHGIVWYQVESRNREGAAQFSCTVDGEDDSEEYDRKLISALRRLGCRLNGVWFDSCRNPDGYDGYYGTFLTQKMGGGFSIHGRFSINRI